MWTSNLGRDYAGVEQNNSNEIDSGNNGYIGYSSKNANNRVCFGGARLLGVCACSFSQLSSVSAKALQATCAGSGISLAPMETFVLTRVPKVVARSWLQMC